MKQEKLKESFASELKAGRTAIYFLSVSQILFALFLPFLLRDIINIISSGTLGTAFAVRCAVYGGVVLIHFAVEWMQNSQWHIYAMKSTALVRKACFSRLLHKPLDSFDGRNTGDLVSRVLQDAEIYASSVSLSSMMLCLNFLRIAGILVFMSMLDVRLTGIVVVFMPLYYLFTLRLNRYLRKTGKEEREAYSVVLQSAQEKISGMETIHYEEKQAFFAGKFGLSVDQFLLKKKKLQVFRSLGSASNQLLLQTIPLAVLALGGMLVAHDQMTLGALLAFYAYLPYISEPLANLTDFNLGRQYALAAGQRLEELFEEKEQAGGCFVPCASVGSISLKGLSFSYAEDKPIIHDLSLKLCAGDRVAVTGASGAGKSTLIKLLLGQLTPNKGEITVNGTVLEEIDRTALLHRVAYMGQTPFLFEGTVLENIAFDAVPEAEQVSRVFHISCVDAFLDAGDIAAISVAPGGTRFSGGERQRIALARALLKAADVLIFDEPTAALDTETERKMVRRLDRFLRENPEKILIAISHRPEILSVCNRRIEFLGNGEIVFQEGQ